MKDLYIRWIGQGGYLLWDGETELCIDPYLSNVVDRVAKRGRMVKAPFAPSALKSNGIICTHDHLDHVDIDAIPEMDRSIPFYAPTHAEKTLRSCGVIQYNPFDEGQSYRIGDFEITAVFADHSVPAIGVLVRNGDLTIYFSGDTEYNERLHALASEKIDVSIICINGKLGNMNVEEAIGLTKILSPRLAIPTHYGMFESNTEDPEKYTSRLPSAMALTYDKTYNLTEVLSHV